LFSYVLLDASGHVVADGSKELIEATVDRHEARKGLVNRAKDYAEEPEEVGPRKKVERFVPKKGRLF
jgi:hypothetical protein